MRVSRRWAVVAAVAVAVQPLSPALASEAMNYNGGSVLAMAGRSAVAVVVDTRVGVGNALIGDAACRVLECGERGVVALRGLHADVQTLLEDLDLRLRLRHIREDRGGDSGPRATLEPETLAALVSSMLYASRLGGRNGRGAPLAPYHLEPVVAGLSRAREPYLCVQDSLGARLVSHTYVVAGTAAHSLQGACEALYEPDLEPDALVDRAVKCMAVGLNRDCLSGRNVVVHLLTADAGHATEERVLVGTAGVNKKHPG